jgi:hypothetical protein
MSSRGVWVGWVAVSLCSCSNKPICAAGDLACLFASITLHDLDSSGNEGPQLQLYPVGTGPLAEMQARSKLPDGGNADGGFGAAGPSIVNFTSSTASQVVALIWSDPFGCRPALCMTPCPKGAECLGASSCAPPLHDGLTRGFTAEQVEYGSQPAQPLDFDLDFTPVSAPGCPDDVTGLLTAFSSTVVVGATAIVEMTIPGANGSSTAGSDGGVVTTGGSGDWWYHWDCHGDSECLSTNPNGTPTGNVDEGPEQASCTELMEFAAQFWGSAATNACDHSPTWSG